MRSMRGLSKLLSSGYRDRSWVDFNGYFVGVIRFDEDMTTQFNVYGGPVSDHLAYYGIPKTDVADRSARAGQPHPPGGGNRELLPAPLRAVS